MSYEKDLALRDIALAESLTTFLPEKIYDIHAHFYHREHDPDGSWQRLLPGVHSIGHGEWKEALLRHPAFSRKRVSGLFFGAVARNAPTAQMNAFIRREVAALGDPLSGALLVATPECPPERVQADLKSGAFKGLKVYHCYSAQAETMKAEITEYAPEWMWATANETGAVMMLHMVLPTAIADPRNQSEIRRLCVKYDRVKLILAHAARCFSHRHARGMASVADLPNVYVDTSAVCEAAAFREALRWFGPGRVLYGSDFFISEFRGRCVTMGDEFHWCYGWENDPATRGKMTLIGLESLLALREALEEFGATQGDIDDIFCRNARRVLSLEEEKGASPVEQWKKAREVIACGTGLLSKRAESFLTTEWPVRFSRAKGARVWDAQGRMYRDFVGGVGAILLGYADEAVNRALRRRLELGSYCSLQAPDEVELAAKLLALHPGMGKVRYARGGGDAMAVAVRVARAATGRSGIAFCGYHGWHDWSLAANVDCGEGQERVPGLCADGVPHELAGTALPFLYNQVDSLRMACAAHGGNLAAIVMEPMRSQRPTSAFLEAIRETLRTTGALLVVDEVTSGLRYGYPGASAGLGLPADLLVYAKAMSNGIPFGVVIGREDVMVAGSRSFISSSYWTDGLGPAAALAVLGRMERDGVYERLQRRGETFASALSTVVRDYPGLGIAVGGMPASPTLIYPEGATEVIRRVNKEMIRRGFLLSKIIYLMDAHQDDDLSLFLERFGEALEVVSVEKERGVLPSEAPPASPVIGRLA